jgi:hypothetical protein
MTMATLGDICVGGSVGARDGFCVGCLEREVDGGEAFVLLGGPDLESSAKLSL